MKTDGIKKIISDMVKVGSILEENLPDIAKSAVELKNEANTTLHNTPLIYSIYSIYDSVYINLNYFIK